MLRTRRGIVGFTASAFDLGPHAGHIAMLEEASRHCDYLVVGLHVNPAAQRDSKNRPLPTVSERYIAAAGNRYVHEVIPYETEEELINLILLLNPDIRFIGEDYKGKDFSGKNIECVKIHYCSRKHSASSSGLRHQIHAAEKAKTVLK